MDQKDLVQELKSIKEEIDFLKRRLKYVEKTLMKPKVKDRFTQMSLIELLEGTGERH